MITRAAFRRLPPPQTPPKGLNNRLFHGVSARNEPDGGRSVYRDARKYGRPATVTWAERLRNSASFIGTVEYPVKQMATKNGSFGVHTTLRVKASPHSYTSFWILLQMWDEMAERALEHLKPKDYVYVSGQLGSYSKNAMQGVEKIKYKVTVKELNYVNRDVPEENIQGVVKSQSECGESSEEKFRNRLHLWQVFFANPSEWYDQRKTKKNPKWPDFRHKSTSEALWMSAGDPPWIKKQLELIDSRLSGRSPKDMYCKPLSRWTSHE